jgi:hypothetical protein
MQMLQFSTGLHRLDPVMLVPVIDANKVMGLCGLRGV